MTSVRLERAIPAPPSRVYRAWHERLDDLAAALPHVAKGVQPGWESALEKLAVRQGADR